MRTLLKGLLLGLAILAAATCGKAVALDFDQGVDVGPILGQARKAVKEDSKEVPGAPIKSPPRIDAYAAALLGLEQGFILGVIGNYEENHPVSAYYGDLFQLEKGSIFRVHDKYEGKIFGNRLGRLEGSFDVVRILSYQDTLIALQKNGRLFAYSPATDLSGIWGLIGVDITKISVRDSRLFASHKSGQLLVYKGDLDEDILSLKGGWIIPSLIFGNSIHNFEKAGKEKNGSRRKGL